MSRADYEEEEWTGRNAWEESMRCDNPACPGDVDGEKVKWTTLVWDDELPSDPDCEFCNTPGTRVDKGTQHWEDS